MLTALGQNEPFVCRLVSTLVKEMGEAFPELVKQQEIIEKVIRGGKYIFTYFGFRYQTVRKSH